MIQKRWSIKPPPPAVQVEALVRHLDILPLTASLLIHRGLHEPGLAGSFLNPAGLRLADFRRLPGAVAAGKRLAESIRRREHVAVFGDYDADGITASAVMAEFIRDRGGLVSVTLPDRLQDGYGLNQKCFQGYLSAGVRLLITVDCGITAVEEIQEARRLGLDVIVTDHHEPGPSLPEAHVLVNPKLEGPDDFRTLAGVGVALQVIRATALALGEDNHESLRKYLDLVSVGTVADVVPLLGENRALTRAGLAVINRNQRPGFKALVQAAGLEPGKLTSQDLAFKLAPRLNAAGRIGSAGKSLDLLLTTSDTEAQVLAQELNQMNTRRQSLERSVLEEAQAQLDHLPHMPQVIVAAEAHWPLGVLGLAASKLSERHQRPCFVLGRHGEQWRGSGRSLPGFPLHEVLNDLAPILEKWGGHELAAGVTLAPEHLEAFRAGMAQIAEARLTGKPWVPELMLEAEVSVSDLTPRLYRELKRLEPFGFLNQRPLLMLSQVRLAAPPRVVGERHLKLKVADRQNRTLDVIGFGLAECSGDLIPGNPLDLAGHLTENTWNGSTTLQLELKDLHWN